MEVIFTEHDAFIIYFSTDDVAKLIKTKVKDGIVLIDDGTPKMFYVDKTRTMLLTVKRGFRKETLPFYIAKWNTIKPYSIKKPVDYRFAQPVNPENIEHILPKFDEFQDDKTPEYVAKLIDLKIMSNLMGKGSKANFIFIIIALIIGAIIGYLVYQSGMIK